MDDIPTCVEKIGHMHIKEKIGGIQEWNFPALGKRYVDFTSIFALLDKASNDYPLSIEINFTSDESKDLNEVNAAVQESYDYLQKLGVQYTFLAQSIMMLCYHSQLP